MKTTLMGTPRHATLAAGFVLDAPFTHMAGKPVFVGGNMPATDVLYGGFQDLLIAMFGGIELIVERAAASGQVSFGWHVGVDIGVRRPESFAKLTKRQSHGNTINRFGPGNASGPFSIGAQMIQIERGITMPPVSGTLRRLPLRRMQPGDSILVSVPPVSLPQTIRKWSLRLGWRFVSVQEPGGAVRVWRLPDPAEPIAAPAAPAESVAAPAAPAEPVAAPSEPRLPMIRRGPTAPAPVASAPVQARRRRLTCNPGACQPMTARRLSRNLM